MPRQLTHALPRTMCTPAMRYRVDTEAQKMGVKVSDVIRMCVVERLGTPSEKAQVMTDILARIKRMNSIDARTQGEIEKCQDALVGSAQN